MDIMQTSSSTTSSDLTDSDITGSGLPQKNGRRRVRIIVACILCALVTLVVLWLLSRLLTPKYMSDIYEGALVAEYYASEKNHELIVIGDCEVYENLSPVKLWEDYGITSYVRGSPQQLTWQSYYLLEDTLRYEKPKVVVFSVLAMKYGTPQSEAYNRLTLDGMRLSPVKVGAVRVSMTEGESLMSYLFPLLRYHERWKSLSEEDVRYLFSSREISFNGFLMRSDVKPLKTLPTAQSLADYTFGDMSLAYLDKMRALCEKNDIAFVLLKAPTLYPHWYPEWERQIQAYADRHALLYINAIEDMEDIGIDFETDTYDAGLHLNLSGAEKLSRHLGGILQETCGLNDLRADQTVSAAWKKKKEEYDRLKAIQLDEIKTEGKVNTLIKTKE